MKYKVFIGTPCYGGMITADYFKSCLRLVNEAPKHNIQLQFGTIGNESLITRARNTLVQLFMDDPGDCTHLLFIDADIGFSEKTIFRMLELDEDIVTGIYPRKAIDWEKVKTRINNKPTIDIDELQAASLEYNLNVKNKDHVEVKKGFIEVLDGATGFMLIKKQVFKKMAKAYPELKFKSDQHLNQPHDTEFNYHDNSEWNYAFCRLWQKIGGSVYADVVSGLNHHGTYVFRGNVGTQFLPQNKK